MRFKIGEEVKCIDDSPSKESVFKVLEKGRIYTVEGKIGDAILVGSAPFDLWKSSRFERIAKGEGR